MTDDSSLAVHIEDSEPRQRHQAGLRVNRRINDTTERDESIHNPTQPTPTGWAPLPPWNLKYIDDGLNGETVCNTSAICHITQRKEVRYVHAKASEDFLKLTTQNANRIGMKINTEKTKMLCVTVARNSVINTFINTGLSRSVAGGESLKMLGFYFGRRPNADAHVTELRKKFLNKLWLIRHMIRANTSKDDLCKIYACYLRPVIEYAQVVYHTLLSEETSQIIEDLQKYTLRLIFGSKVSYNKALQNGSLTTLKSRREAAFEKFAVAASRNPRFADTWFPKNEKRNLRKTEEFKVKKTKYDRLKYSPINCMRRLLNNMNKKS